MSKYQVSANYPELPGRGGPGGGLFFVLGL